MDFKNSSTTTDASQTTYPHTDSIAKRYGFFVAKKLQWFAGNKWRLGGLIIFMIAMWYMLLFALPRSIIFSYAGNACRSELTIAPEAHRTIGNTHAVVYEKHTRFLNRSLFSLKTCVEAISAPSPGVARIASAPGGISLFRANYKISVPELPTLSPRTTSESIPLSAPVKFELSHSDTIFNYMLRKGTGSQHCKVIGREINCELAALNLMQGQSHDVELVRQFKDDEPRMIAATKLQILPALHVRSSSIAANQVVYDKPKQISITFDKPLASTAVTLVTKGGPDIAVQQKISDSVLTLSWADDLAREKTFILTLSGATATDGSTLDGSYQISFSTSGGPKVTNVSIANSGVAPNSRIIVTFDQPLAPNQDINAYARITDGSAVIAYAKNQLIFQLRDMGNCQAFSLLVAKGLSGENGVISGASWQHDSRTICGSSKVIGYSIQGKPLVAHYFGEGPSTILFTGGIHGNEPSSVYLLNDFIAHLQKEGYKIPAGRQIVIVPNVNPDGIAIGQRYNMRNVNIDRNFPESDWVSDIVVRNNEVVVGGGGSAPLSEPEAKALATLTTQLRPRLMMSFHARGSLVGANDAADSRAIASSYARSVGYLPMFDNAEDVMGHTFTGEYEMWITEAFNSAAVLVELPDYQGRYFTKHQQALWNIIKL